MKEALVGYHSLTSHRYFSSSDLSVSQYRQLFYCICWVVRSLLTENSESSISFPFSFSSPAILLPSIEMHEFRGDHANSTYSLSCCHLSTSPARMHFLHHNFWPTDDPERQLLFKTCAQQQQTVWWRQKKEGSRRVGVEWSGVESSQVLFSCSAHVLCMGLLCIFQGPSGLAVYEYTHTHILDGTSSLQSTALYGVGEWLPEGVGGSLEQEAKAMRATVSRRGNLGCTPKLPIRLTVAEMSRNVKDAKLCMTNITKKAAPLHKY